jgi:hypothetical protein
LASLLLDLQKERSAVALSLYMSQKTGAKTDLSQVFATTDKTLDKLDWKVLGPEKVFSSKLRFQIKLDDFRYVLPIVM